MSQVEDVDFPDHVSEKLNAVIEYMRNDLKTFVYKIDSSAELRGAYLKPLPGTKAHRVVYVRLRPAGKGGIHMWTPHAENKSDWPIAFAQCSADELCVVVKGLYDKATVPSRWQKEYLAERQ